MFELQPELKKLYDDKAAWKHHLPKSIVELLGYPAATLLFYLCYLQGKGYYRKTDMKGRDWTKQALKAMLPYTNLRITALKTAMQRLLDEKLIQVTQDRSWERDYLWRVNFKKMERFYKFAEAYYAKKVNNPRRPANYWQDFKENNPDIVDEFKHLMYRNTKCHSE